MEPLSKHPLEAVSFGLFSYVEGLPGFRSLAVEPRSTSPATAAALKAWHAEYGPLQLPDDLAAFFEVLMCGAVCHVPHHDDSKLDLC